MNTKVFKNGNSQAVRILKGPQLEDDEVEIIKRANELIIRPQKTQNATILFDLLASFEAELKRPEIKFRELKYPI